MWYLGQGHFCYRGLNFFDSPGSRQAQGIVIDRGRYLGKLNLSLHFFKSVHFHHSPIVEHDSAG